AAGRCGTDCRCHVASGLRVRQREIDVIAAIDGQVVDAALVNGLGDFGFGGFDRSGLRGYRYALLHATKFELGVVCSVLSHGYRDRVIFKGSEIRATVYGQPVLTWGQSNEVVEAIVIGHGGALGGSDRVYYRDLGALDGKPLRITHGSGERSG